MATDTRNEDNDRAKPLVESRPIAESAKAAVGREQDLDFEPDSATVATANGPLQDAPSESVVASVWYIADRSGKQVGPLPLSQLRQRAAAGTLLPDDKVWRSGLTVWMSARGVAELSESFSGRDSPPEALPPAIGQAVMPSFADFKQFLASPIFFSTLGRVCAVLSFLVAFGSVLLSYWQKTWFDGALWLAIMALVGEATGALLATLQRIELQVAKNESLNQGKSKSNVGKQH